MRNTNYVALLLALTFSSIAFGQGSGPAATAGFAASKTPASDPATDEIRASSKAFVDAFNEGDAEAIAQLWTEDAQYVDESGTVHEGRDAIERAYSELFDQNSNVKIQLSIDSLRLVSAAVAIEDGRAVVIPPPAGPAGYSQYTAVHVKDGDQWRMASVRETWVEASVTPQSMADFEWLIGSWECEEHGVKSEMVYRWIADQTFIERSYTTTAVDGTTSSGVQVIGWNPMHNHLQSWSFSPDGGHAVGVWTPVDGGWSAKMSGITGDGIPTRSVNLLAKLDDNGCVWQSTQRFAGEVVLPDTDEVVIKRKSDNR